MFSNAKQQDIGTHPSCKKILLYIFIDKIQQYLSREISESQASFRLRQGTCDHIATVKSMIQKMNDRNQPMVLFIDYSKAFNCVKHK